MLHPSCVHTSQSVSQSSTALPPSPLVSSTQQVGSQRKLYLRFLLPLLSRATSPPATYSARPRPTTTSPSTTRPRPRPPRDPLSYVFLFPFLRSPSSSAPPPSLVACNTFLPAIPETKRTTVDGGRGQRNVRYRRRCSAVEVGCPPQITIGSKCVGHGGTREQE